MREVQFSRRWMFHLMIVYIGVTLSQLSMLTMIGRYVYVVRDVWTGTSTVVCTMVCS